jgi:hypothetical protein
MRWKETKPGRYEAKMDGREAMIRQRDGRWHWFIAYPGETETRRGDAASRRAAEQAVARNL